ncbi:MAG: inositol monophosphatase [Acidobacteria bacterium]|nr:MAG: inositol monophosphatase [Acidobacteriota bacterium]RLE20152.1 MAG: inositol monophosphatase [Acidobacteriota bacterium]
MSKQELDKQFESIDFRERLGLLKELGHLAHRLLMNHYGKIESYEFKGEVDIVTVADKAVEKAVVERITALFPDDSILAEEGGTHRGRSGWSWVIDPLDGTTNFAHSYPFFAFSCGLRYNDDTRAGLVEIPVMRETFFATKDGGAFLNEKPIAVSTVNCVRQALLVTGLPYFRAKVMDELFAPMRQVALKGQGLRRGGAASVDLCYVACGRLDGYFEIGLKPWDMAAGELIVREAGGRLSDYRGNPFTIFGKELVASNALIHNELIEEVLNPNE